VYSKVAKFLLLNCYELAKSLLECEIIIYIYRHTHRVFQWKISSLQVGGEGGGEGKDMRRKFS